MSHASGVVKIISQEFKTAESLARSTFVKPTLNFENNLRIYSNLFIRIDDWENIITAFLFFYKHLYTENNARVNLPDP